MSTNHQITVKHPLLMIYMEQPASLQVHGLQAGPKVQG